MLSILESEDERGKLGAPVQSQSKLWDLGGATCRRMLNIKVNFELACQLLIPTGGGVVHRETKAAILGSKSDCITSGDMISFAIELGSLRSVDLSEFTGGIRIVSVDVLSEESVHRVLKDIKTNVGAETSVILNHEVGVSLVNLVGIGEPKCYQNT